MKKLHGPFSDPSEMSRGAANMLNPMVQTYSGEFTGNYSAVLGAPGVGGRVSDVWLSVGSSGKDDTNTLSLTADVLINDTSCLSTQPVIAHVSGEAAQQKTTAITGDTGITQAALDYDNNEFSPGDVLTCIFELTRTASPTTEMKNAIVVVEFEPAIN